MRNKKLLSIVLALIIVFSTFTTVFAATYDLYHAVSIENDVKFRDFARKPSVFKKVVSEKENYLQKHRNGKYYLVAEIDQQLEAGAFSTAEAIINLEPYIEIKGVATVEERIDTVLENNTAPETSDYYTPESWSAYEAARTELESIKEKRFEKEEILNNKIEALENAYVALEAAFVDKSELEAELDKAKARDSSNYTPESYAILESAIVAGEEILADENASRTDVEFAIKNLKNAIASLVEVNKIVYVEKLENITVTKGEEVELPETVTVVYKDDSTGEKSVVWNPESVETSVAGTFEYVGNVEGTELKANLTVIVREGIDKAILESTIAEAREKLKENLTPVEKEKLQKVIATAESVLENSTSQEEINSAVADLREILDSLEGIPVITNLKPDVDVNIQPGQSVKISFDSQPGGVANFEVGMPISRYRRSARVQSNMEEVSPGHYEGIWTAPEGMYGEGFVVSVSLQTTEGLLITEKAVGTINITNEFTVSYVIGNEVIGTEALKSGEKPKNVPTPSKDGYTFSHWELGDVRVEPEKTTITENTTFTAIMNPVGNLSATVEYVDINGNELKEFKTIENLGFGSELTEDAPEIIGYRPRAEQLSIVVGTGENKISFVYEARTDIAYMVNYKFGKEVIKESETKYGIYNEDNIVDVPEIPGYNPVNENSSILLDSVEGNEITLEYLPRTDIPYTIKHVEILEDGSERVLGTVTKTGTYKSIVSENAGEYPGLTAVEGTKEIELNSLENNTITFEYREITGLYYKVNYTNRQNETWSKEIPARYGEVIKEDTIRAMAVENGGQDYEIETIDKASIIIDDRVENNLFNVNVYKIYPLSKHQDLQNLLDEANELVKPPYADKNAQWTNYWTAFENAKNTYGNTLLTEDNLEELKNSLEDNIEIIKMIADFDSAWKDRVAPKGFEKTINDQAQTPDVYGRFKIYYNQFTNTIVVGMSEEQQGKTFAPGAIGVGLKTAMLNVLNSDKLYTVESKGITATIRTSEGEKVSDSELQSEGMRLAVEWLPEGADPFKNKWGELIGTPPVYFIMHGKTSKGTEVHRSYTFVFVDKGDV